MVSGKGSRGRRQVTRSASPVCGICENPRWNVKKELALRALEGKVVERLACPDGRIQARDSPKARSQRGSAPVEGYVGKLSGVRRALQS